MRKQTGKFVAADGGTIFLDEIGDMSLRTQAKVLRVLQEGEVEPVGSATVIKVDVRVIAATNKDLTEEIKGGRFREDLYYRLNVIPIRTPPLRERRDDIPVLAEHFAKLFSEEHNYHPKKFTPAAQKAMQDAPWRGNVRELRNMIERLVIMVPSETIDISDLPAEFFRAATDIISSVHEAVDAAGVQGRGGEGVHPGEAARVRLERLEDGRGDRHAALESVQEDRAVQHQTRDGRGSDGGWGEAEWSLQATA